MVRNTATLLNHSWRGGSLEDRLKKELLSRDQLLEIGNALIQAVTHIASQELVHRDIKPANIMFANASGPAVLGDFGIVRDLTKASLTASYVAFGPCTPFFAAPEQLNNDKFLIDWRTDQFAIATTLSVAHFGFHPYRAAGENDDQAIHRVVARSGPSVEFIQAANNEGLPALVTMLGSWPVLRFRTPESLADAWAVQGGNS